MALGDPYATLLEVKQYVGIREDITEKDTQLTWALESASREIENFCERQFNRADTVSQRVFRVTNTSVLEVDDFWTADGLVLETDTSGTGTFGTTWTASDFELLPLNGIVGHETGWPYNEIEAVRSLWFPTRSGRAAVRVAAKWGWAAVPAPVHQACLMMAARNYKLADAPTGLAGVNEFGVVRVRDMPDIEKKIKRYKRIGVHVG